ncbi:MAG: flavin reductase family protein [Candidatus Aenigmatarchaeota archaeon]
MSVRLLSPRLTVLLLTRDKGGDVRAAPFSWIIPISFKPPLIVVAISKENMGTLPNIKREGMFTINIVSLSWAEKAIKCEKLKRPLKVGLKIKEIGFPVPVIAEAKAWMACRLKDIIDCGGDHVIVIGCIEKQRPEKWKKEIQPLLHISGDEFAYIGEIKKIKR